MNLSQVKVWVFDLDGVVWRGNSAVAGAVESIATLQKRGCHTLFASNNSTRTPQFFAEKLNGLNICAAPDQVLTSTTVAAAHLQRRFPSGGRVFVVGEAGLCAQLQDAGFEVTQNTDQTPGEVVAVVAGLAREFHYAQLARAQHYLLQGAPLVATNRDATFPIEGGVLPGAGTIVAAIETAGGTPAQTMGKPEPAMLQQVARQFALQPGAVAMVGDRLDTDIACAHRAGIGSVWVATGVVSWEQARAAQGEEKPDLLVDDLPALVRLVEAS